MTLLTGRQIEAAGLGGWAKLLNGLQTRIDTVDFATGLKAVTAIGAAAEETDHHPDLNLRFTHLDVRLTSHDEGGVTQRDVSLARTITAVAAELGCSVSTAGLSRIEFGLDSPDSATIVAFWRAALGLTSGDGPGDEAVDSSGALPTLWFQPSGVEEPRQRWHPDVWVDPSEVQPRIDAALAAGGTLVDRSEAPAFWVLADPEGNRVCLCTWQDRD